jgi:AbrB family looped-hinge helix DNA binding protein
MQTTIDKAGRLVIPRSIRERLHLRGGETLEVEEEHGTIRIARAQRAVTLVEDHGILTAELDPPLAATTAEEVRDVLERTRR